MEQLKTLGKLAKDEVTNFSGIVMGVCVYLNGCVRIGIQSTSLNKDGEPTDIIWFDDNQITILGDSNITKVSNLEESTFMNKKVGGPQDDPKKDVAIPKFLKAPK